jgi:hypothetical protein
VYTLQVGIAGVPHNQHALLFDFAFILPGFGVCIFVVLFQTLTMLQEFE